MFLGIISYVMGILMENVIPRYGWFRYLNPVRTSYSHPCRLYALYFEGPFQQKRECVHCHYGSFSGTFSDGDGSPCSSYTILPDLAEGIDTHASPYHESIPWLWNCGLDEM